MHPLKALKALNDKQQVKIGKQCQDNCNLLDSRNLGSFYINIPIYIIFVNLKFIYNLFINYILQDIKFIFFFASHWACPSAISSHRISVTTQVQRGKGTEAQRHRVVCLF